jgi:purine-binding chemotaxis protein CheW
VYFFCRFSRCSARLPGTGGVSPVPWTLATADTVQMVVARLGTEEYGIPITQVREIIQIPPVTRVPAMPDFFTGVCNLRGRIVPLIDLRKRFRLSAATETEPPRAIIAGAGAVSAGLIADAVADVLRFPGAAITAVPDVQRHIDREFLAGMYMRGSRMIVVLNAERLVADIERDVTPAAG